MSSFLSELVVTPYPSTAAADGRNWRLTQDLVYDSDAYGLIVVPAGFVTDFASTPTVIWSAVPPWGRYGPAAVVHDQCYWLHSTGRRPLTREQADDVLREAMAVLDVPSLLSNMIYDGVRSGGQDSWDEDFRRSSLGEAHVS